MGTGSDRINYKIMMRALIKELAVPKDPHSWGSIANRLSDPY